MHIGAKSIVYLGLSLTTICFYSKAQEKRSFNENIHELSGEEVGFTPGYVISFRNNLVITIVNETKTSSLSVDLQTDTKKYAIEYSTNPVNTWGFGIDYKWLTFQFTKQMPWSKSNSTRGNTENAGFGFGITGRKLAFRNFLERSKGFYLENTDDWFTNYLEQNGTNYLRSDLESYTYYSSLNYVFNNKKFSNNASLWQLERQEKAAGSFIAGISYIFNSYNSDSTIIPNLLLDSFPSTGNSSFELNSLGANVGYAATIPIGKRKKWFFTFALIPGLSVQWGRITVEEIGTVQAKNIHGLQSEFRIGFGYNGDRWYVGSTARTYSNLNNIDGGEPFSISNSFGRFYVGYRFNPPKIQSKFLKMIWL